MVSSQSTERVSRLGAVVNYIEKDFLRNSLISILTIFSFWLVIFTTEFISVSTRDVIQITNGIIMLVIVTIVVSMYTIIEQDKQTHLVTRLRILLPFAIMWSFVSLLVTYIFSRAFYLNVLFLEVSWRDPEIYGEFFPDLFWDILFYKPVITAGIIFSMLSVVVLANLYCLFVSIVISQHSFESMEEETTKIQTVEDSIENVDDDDE